MTAWSPIELTVTFGPSSSPLYPRAVASATQHAATAAEVAPETWRASLQPLRRPRSLRPGSSAPAGRGELEGNGGPGRRILRAPYARPFDDRVRQGVAAALRVQSGTFPGGTLAQVRALPPFRRGVGRRVLLLPAVFLRRSGPCARLPARGVSVDSRWWSRGTSN
jgi:hypothetical protein